MGYNHTQRGWVILGFLAFLAALVGVIVFTVPHETRLTVVSVTALAAVIMVLFSSLTVKVDSQSIGLAFGPGLIRRTIAIADVASVEGVPTKWWYGYGIRLTPLGWMWNVSGQQGVKLTYRNGKSFIIGTDDPDGLVRAIRQYVRA